MDCGITQWYLLSIILFNIYTEKLIRKAFDNVEEGAMVGCHLINEIRFTDDKTVLASTKKDCKT